MNAAAKSRWPWWRVAGLLLVAVPWVVVYLMLYGLYWICLRVAIWGWWCSRGRDVLLVYSDSPIWREYVEQNMLPRFSKRAIVMNWSERRRWRFSLGWMAFHHFGGNREFNPMAVVFRPFRRTRTFRFWTAFRAMKAGRPAALAAKERELLDYVGIAH
jgi:hypothetical protein